MTSVVIILVCILAIVGGFVTGDLAYTGFYLMIGAIVVFVAMTAIQYKIKQKCRCRRCGSIEVFEEKKLVVVGVKRRCEKCSSKLREDEVINK